MPVAETLVKIAAFLETTELLEDDERQIFVRVIKRMTSDDDLDLKLRDWNAVAVDAAWFKARTHEIANTETDKRNKYQKKHFGSVEDRNLPKWQAEARLEGDPTWDELNRRALQAHQLQILADRVCDIAIQSLRSYEAQGNNQRFYGRIETAAP